MLYKTSPWYQKGLNLQTSSRGTSMDVSLIICTRDRCEQLVRCLDAVARIDFTRAWELILVNNGSLDDTAAVIQKFIASTSICTRNVFEPRPGKSNALNTALSIARGQVLAFTDDDCYPATDFLTRIWPAFEDTSVGYITGRILLHDPADAPIAIIESTTPRTLPARYFVGPGDVSGANMAFRRSVLYQIGGFDPFFGPGSRSQAVAEDLDVAGRASALGWKGKYRPEVVVRHHHGRKGSDRLQLFKSYAVGMGAYHMKLLLQGGEFWWFVKSVYRIPRRYRFFGKIVLWEQVGAAKYAHVYLMQRFRGLLFGRKLGKS
jgi:cellulose synthase/poly-beta-1,6-N-acetylglucosamine synthase-like glycosyltransferase